MDSKKNKGKKQQVTGLREDTLNTGGKTRQDLQAIYAIAEEQLNIDPELSDLMDKAWKNGWDKARWDLEFRNTDWYKRNSKSMREYLLASADPTNADFVEKKKDTEEAVRQRARDKGVNLSSERIAELATKSMMYGWGEAGQEYELDRAIIESPSEGAYGGDILKNADSLRKLAYNNGVDYGSEWFTSAGKSIAGGLTDETYWEEQIRKEAASKFPVFAEQIGLGVDVAAIANPYMKMMAEEWDMPLTSITLDNDVILGALTNYTDKGQPIAENLGDFRLRLRKDPRWLNTAKAQNEIMGTAAKVMQMFGITA